MIILQAAAQRLERAMRALRIAAVTAGLMAAGAVFGAVAGVTTLAAWALKDGGFRDLASDLGFVLGYGAFFGGVFGAVLGPLAAWLLMRHVPLGLAVGGTTLGTVAGMAAGLLFPDFGVSFYGGFAGFALA
ncbi:MAG TPA: hypothetical protein VHG08_10415, partial [Longimicrobium sp.]|nr:hypothetical protein [Longimicrobium sp.]